MRRITLTLLVLSFALELSAHSDMYVHKNFGRVSTCVLTGFSYEEVYKLEIAGQLADKLSDMTGNKTRLFLDYKHQYTSIGFKPVYRVGFGEMERTDGKGWIKEKGLVVRILANELDITAVLKLAEYALLHESRIKAVQRPVVDSLWESRVHRMDAVPDDITGEVLRGEPSSRIAEVMDGKVYRTVKVGDSNGRDTEATYYFRNGKYHIVKQDHAGETELAVFDSLYQISGDYMGVLVFQDRESFTYIRYNGGVRIGERHLFSAGNNYYPYEVQRIGNDLMAVSYRPRNYNYEFLDSQGTWNKLRGCSKIMFYSPLMDAIVEDGTKLIMDSMSRENYSHRNMPGH